MAATKLRILGPRIAVSDTRIARPGPKVADPHYLTPEHQAWRAEIIRRSGGCCQDTAHRGDRRAARLYADHVEELRDGGAPFDLNNGLARCGSCHTRKTLAERARRMAASP